MSSGRLTVVLSQSRSKNPQKRHLEEEIAAAIVMQQGIDFGVVPHVYDLYPDDTGSLYLSSIQGDIVLLAWIYPRAAHWVLDRSGIQGREGASLLRSMGEEDDDEDAAGEDTPERHGVGAADIPDREIYCLDLRAYDSSQPYLDEIRRIVTVRAHPRAAKADSGALVPLMEWIAGTPQPVQLERFLHPKKNGGLEGAGEDGGGRRWYPVIDYSRCTNCLECIDFCLFGVYGVDHAERILVEQQDNCKRGCPACSRVCPENAIIFPEHKSPAIAGAPGEGPSALKIDLSKLFGAPNAIEIAAAERDAELVKDGREAVGLTVGIPKRQAGKAPQPKDELDTLLDSLDNLL